MFFWGTYRFFLHLKICTDHDAYGQSHHLLIVNQLRMSGEHLYIEQRKNIHTTLLLLLLLLTLFLLLLLLLLPLFYSSSYSVISPPSQVSPHHCNTRYQAGIACRSLGTRSGIWSRSKSRRSSCSRRSTWHPCAPSWAYCQSTPHLANPAQTQSSGTWTRL